MALHTLSRSFCYSAWRSLFIIFFSLFVATTFSRMVSFTTQTLTNVASPSSKFEQRVVPTPRILVFAHAAPMHSTLPPAAPPEPWQTLNESLLPYPIFYAATAVLDNSIVLLGGCLTSTCAVPLGTSTTNGTGTQSILQGKTKPQSGHLNGSATGRRKLSSLLNATANNVRDERRTHPSMSLPLLGVDSPYHERSIALEVETQTMMPLHRLTLPTGRGFAGRHAAVTLTDTVYVPRSCTMTTLSPADIAALSEHDFHELQTSYASVIAFYPEDKKKKQQKRSALLNRLQGEEDGGGVDAPSYNLSYYEVPIDRVRVNASCTALATENKILIIGGFLLSQQRVTASVDSFNVVTRKYDAEVVYLSSPVLQPSVATSTGFAAVAGGWTYAMDEKSSYNLSLTASTLSSSSSAPPTPVPTKPVVQYLFDLLFFDGDRFSSQRRRPDLVGAPRNPPRLGRRVRASSLSSICLSPVDAGLLPEGAVRDILLSEGGCHVEVFGGQVVLTDHNLGHLAVLDLRATSTQGVRRDSPGTVLTGAMHDRPMPSLASPQPPVEFAAGSFAGGAAAAADVERRAARAMWQSDAGHWLLLDSEKKMKGEADVSNTYRSTGSKRSFNVKAESENRERLTSAAVPPSITAADSASSVTPLPPSSSISFSQSSSSSSTDTPSTTTTTAAPTPPPEPIYHYRWERPMLIPLPLSRPRSALQRGNAQRAAATQLRVPLPAEGSENATSTTTTSTTVEPPAATTPPPDADPTTSTILVFMALGGEDVWTQELVPTGEVHGTKAKVFSSPLADSSVKMSFKGNFDSALRGEEVVVRRAAAQRWARRAVPDRDYDAGRADLLAVRMPTPLWPAELTLQTTSEGTIHLDFPDVNFTHYCSWPQPRYTVRAGGEEGEAKAEHHVSGEEDVVCAVRLSSRRDCVGNTAGTLDALYDGHPNASLLFTASGSTTPVYVCFGFTAQPPAWPLCRTQRSFSVLNPMMPLRILDNAPTTPPSPPPTPSRDPSDKTTSSPLFILAVGISMVTLLVAVLLVARLQQVPEEGLLVDDLFARNDSRSLNRHGHQPGRMGELLGNYTRLPGQEGEGGDGNGRGDEDSGGDEEGSSGGGPHALTRRADFNYLVASVAATDEARMLEAAADVLRLHQHRYRILSRVGQGAHSLCFLALRKPSPVAPTGSAASGLGVGFNGGGGGGRRGGPRFPAFPLPAFATAGGGYGSNPHSGHNGRGNSTATAAAAAASASSSLWAARYDQKAAVVVKYTQCPDDTTRAVITRLCERLRDLQSSSGGAAGGSGRSGAGAATISYGGRYSHRSGSNYSNNTMSRHSRTSSGAAAAVAASWTRDDPQEKQQHSEQTALQRRTPLPSEVTSRAVSGMSTSPAPMPHEAADPTSHSTLEGAATGEWNSQAQVPSKLCTDANTKSATGAGAFAQEELDEMNEEGVCAWLDAHEVDIVLSLFLLLPADLFVSYEVSVLQQQQQQQQLRQQQHAFSSHSRGSGLVMVGGGSVESQTASLYRVTAQWNRQCMYIGARHRNGKSDNTDGEKGGNKTKADRLSETARQVGREIRDRLKRTVFTESRVTVGRKNAERAAEERLSPAARAFVASLSRPATRVCWEACMNPLRPPIVSPWSLCLVMPYERAGDLADFMARGQQVMSADAWRVPGYWGSCTTAQDTAPGEVERDTARDCNTEGRAVHEGFDAILTLTDAKHCWTESLLCSLLFQISAGLQLLHQQSPPILHGNVKPTNVLLREPTVFSVACRRVYRTPLPRGEVHNSPSLHELHTPEAGGQPHSRSPHSLQSNQGLTDLKHRTNAYMHNSAAAASVLRSGSPSSFAFHTGNATLPAPAPKATMEASPSEGPQPRPPPAEWYLSTKSYLPVSLTDGGMSWWLSVQLPQRLRGCFGFTTRSTLRQTAAGCCWLRRYCTASERRTNVEAVGAAGVPCATAVAALAHFLYTFVGVPPHIAPELVWGQLCSLSSAAALGLANSSVNSGTRRQSSSYARRARRELLDDGAGPSRRTAAPRRSRHHHPHPSTSSMQPDPVSASSFTSVVRVMQPDSSDGAAAAATAAAATTTTTTKSDVPALHVEAATETRPLDGEPHNTEAGKVSRDLDDDLMFNDVIADEESYSNNNNNNISNAQDAAQQVKITCAQDSSAGEAEDPLRAQTENVPSNDRSGARVSNSSSNSSATTMSDDEARLLNDSTDAEDQDEEEDDYEEGVFTPEEAALLTSTMWKAEGLTRVSRPSVRDRPHRSSNIDRSHSADGSANNGAAGPSTSHARPPSASRLVGGVPSTLSDAAPTHPSTSPLPFPLPSATAAAAFSPLLPSHTAFFAQRQPHGYDRHGTSGGLHGGAPAGGGSQTSSSVYEMLIQRVLTMDTASDVWSVGLLIYEMCTDALQLQASTVDDNNSTNNNTEAGDGRGGVSEESENKSSDATEAPSATSKLAQRAFAALLGDLYTLARSNTTSVPHTGPQERNDESTPSATTAALRAPATASPHYEGAGEEDMDSDRTCWPRSCAVEDEVACAFTRAGYSPTFAALMARVLSPVAARRPTAAEVVDQVRLVVPFHSATGASAATAAASPNVNGSPCMNALPDAHLAVSQHGNGRIDLGRNAGYSPSAMPSSSPAAGVPPTTRATTESDSGDSGRAAAAAAVLNERTAVMKLRKRCWC